MTGDLRKLIDEVKRVKELAQPANQELGVHVTLSFSPSFVYEKYEISRLHEKKIIKELQELCEGEPEIQWHDRYLYSIDHLRI